MTVRGGTGNDQLSSGSWQGKSPMITGGTGERHARRVEQWRRNAAHARRPGRRHHGHLTSWRGGLLYGGPGGDRLVYRSGNVFYPRALELSGGLGNDTDGSNGLVANWFVAIARGLGTDTVELGSYSQYSDFSIDLVACSDCVERVVGSAQDDEIAGGAEPQVIRGAAGDDELDGGGGRDRVFGQAGDDIIRASDASTDTITCGGGTDSATADPQDIVAPDCEDVEHSRRGR